MRYKFLTAFLIMIISNNCSTNKYAASNKKYKQQAKALANELKKQPAGIDSVKNAASWAGTTNFSMRKPNLVIIHHTAQNSCHQYFYFATNRSERSLCDL